MEKNYKSFNMYISQKIEVNLLIKDTSKCSMIITAIVLPHMLPVSFHCIRIQVLIQTKYAMIKYENRFN